MRKGLAGLILSIMLANTALADMPYQGHAEFDEQYTAPDEKLFTGKTEYLENDSETPGI